MIKILFVCLGNICRSPMAEFVFKDMVKKEVSVIYSSLTQLQPAAKKLEIRFTPEQGRN